jgi:hypothetical protein
MFAESDNSPGQEKTRSSTENIDRGRQPALAIHFKRGIDAPPEGAPPESIAGRFLSEPARDQGS